MASITLRGNPINTSGDLPAVGSTAPDFTLTGGDLADVSLSDFAGKTSSSVSYRASIPRYALHLHRNAISTPQQIQIA